MIGKILHIEKSPSKFRCCAAEGSVDFVIFSPHLCLETVFPALKLGQSCYKYEHIFSLKLGI